jgi:hypothetical protein
METNERREARTESLFREVNERIAEKADDSPVQIATFICECGDPSCTNPITAPLDEYEGVRSTSRLFLVRPGHADTSLERVVEERNGYDVVEKVHPDAADVAEETDPRND